MIFKTPRRQSHQQLRVQNVRKGTEEVINVGLGLCRNGAVIAHRIAICGVSMSSRMRRRVPYCLRSLPISYRGRWLRSGRRDCRLYSLSRKCKDTTSWTSVPTITTTTIHTTSSPPTPKPSQTPLLPVTPMIPSTVCAGTISHGCSYCIKKKSQSSTWCSGVTSRTWWSTRGR